MYHHLVGEAVAVVYMARDTVPGQLYVDLLEEEAYCRLLEIEEMAIAGHLFEYEEIQEIPGLLKVAKAAIAKARQCLRK